MRTLDRDTDRRSIEARLARLTPDHRARWGSFDVGKMVVHVEDALRLYLGEIVRTSPPASAFHPVRHFPLKHFVIYLMPFPKGAPTTPESLARTYCGDLDRERQSLLATIERFVNRDRKQALAPHRLFGTLSHGAYARLAYRHFDHHLRQFGE